MKNILQTTGFIILLLGAAFAGAWLWVKIIIDVREQTVRDVVYQLQHEAK